MPSRYILNIEETFGKELWLQGVDPKMERINRDDPNSPTEQAKDKEGVLKWVVTLSAKMTAFDNAKYENIPITVASPTKPLDDAPHGALVMVNTLEMGVMGKDKGGYTVFYSAESVRLQQTPRIQPTQPSQPSRVPSGQ
jgi:hypothetical protein